jgi:hypothetical protein
MSKCVISCVKAACAGLLVGAVVLGTNQATRAADDCLTGPNRQPGPGGHWYFHLDRATDRRCWYLVEATGRPPTAETLQPQPAEPLQQPQPTFGSFFSSLGITGSSGQPDPNSGDPRILQPNRADDARSDDSAPGRQSRIVRRPVAEASLAPKPRRPAPAPARPPAQHADDQAASSKPDERDALFQEFLKWRQRQ